jgi:flavin-binding protein dodecin
MRPTQEQRTRVLGLLGVGLDTDGHHRITRTEDFLLVGGSEETHERMQETAIKFEEALDRRGKTLADVEVAEVIDLIQEATE